MLFPGLPVQVRDHALGMKDDVPKSDVNKEFYTQNVEKEVKTAIVNLIRYSCRGWERRREKKGECLIKNGLHWPLSHRRTVHSNIRPVFKKLKRDL